MKMTQRFKKFAAIVLACMLILAMSACSNQGSSQPASSNDTSGSTSATPSQSGLENEKPIKFTMTYSDNPTFPFDANWMPINKVQELYNAEIEFQVYPISEYNNKVTLSLNTGNPPDVMMRVNASSNPFSEFAINGSFVPISDYYDWTPNTKALLEDNNLMDQVGNVSAKDGKLYHFPRISDKPIYNGGLLIRVDLLERYKLDRPTTYEELYNVCKVFKQNYPKSYPVTAYVGTGDFYKPTMPSFGISLGKGSDTGSYVLSYDYEKKEYFAGAISDNFKDYARFFAKLYAEGLLDPEFTNNPSDQWTRKLSNGTSMVTWSAYDQIGGIEANATEKGTKFDMLVPLMGTVAARCEAKPSLSDGIAISSSTTKRSDFERLVRTVDNLFCSPEAIWLFSRGKEGETYDMVDGKVKFKDSLINDPNGLFKALQVGYGIGIYNFQMVWERDFELTKKDDNYTVINDKATEMNSMPAQPPMPKFDPDTAEEVGILQAPLADTFEVWTVDFITGKKNVETDWDAFVKEMESKGINDLLKLYKDNLPK